MVQQGIGSSSSAEVYIHADERDAAPYATSIIEGTSPADSTVLADGLVALPVPGHTKGSVVFQLDETFLFTGDSLCRLRDA
jgi:glyoxylase-like metal-dependent hydrolase (beta-lactamase superfamily II)